MRNGLLGSIAALVAGAGLAFGQSPPRPAALPTSQPATVMAQSGTPEPVPMGPSSIGAAATTVDPGAFVGGMDGYTPYNGEPQLTAERASVQLDYLLWWIRPFHPAYPLVTVGTTGTNGVLNGPGSATLVGPGNFDFSPESGGRYTIDYWLKRDRRIGFEFSAFALEQRSVVTTFGFGNQTVARPVIDANTGLPQALLVASPGFATGGVQVSAKSRLWGYEANAKFKLYCDATKELMALTGFRYMDLEERMDVSQRTRLAAGVTQSFFGIPFFSPFEIDVADSFQTRNQYYFWQIGLQGEWHYNRWRALLTAKFDMGFDHQTEVINGNSTLFPTQASFTAGAGNTVPGGLLALSSNIGRRHAEPFTVMPELGFQLGYRFFQCTDLFLGYQFAYISRVIRPGDQVNPVINPTFLPTSSTFGSTIGPAAPVPVIRQNDFWVQGVNWGIRITY